MKPIATMNVIPFIDVMLVLLAIVLTTATFVAEGRIPVRLPTADHAEALQPEVTVEISITADGTLYLDGLQYGVDAFATLVQAMESQTRFVLRVDEAAAFRHFVTVIDVLKANGLQNVSIITQASAS